MGLFYFRRNQRSSSTHDHIRLISGEISQGLIDYLKIVTGSELLTVLLLAIRQITCSKLLFILKTTLGYLA